MFTADKRALVYPLTYSAALSSEIAADEPECEGSSAVSFPDDPNERTLVPFWLSLNEYNTLASAVDVGADIAYGVEAQAVIQLWLRNTGCADMICEFLKGCTADAIQSVEGLANWQRDVAASAAKQQEYQDEYTGNPSDINPDAPDDNFDGDASPDRELALCASCAAYVRYFAAAKVRQLDIVYGGVFTALSLLLILIPGFGWALALGLGVALGGATLIAGVAYETARNALTNVAAINAVACCMSDALAGVANTEANFLTSLNTCAFETGTYREIVRGFVEASLADNYLTFQDYLGTAYRAIQNDEPVICTCECTTYDFEAESNQPPVEPRDVSGTPYSVYVFPAGWYNVEAGTGNWQTQILVPILPGYNQVQANYSNTRTIADLSLTGVGWTDSTVSFLTTIDNFVNDAPGDWGRVFDITTPPAGATHLLFYLGSADTDDPGLRWRHIEFCVV